MDKFENAVVPGGLILYDSSLISRKVNRTDLTVMGVPATQMAVDHQVDKLANMVMIGKFAKQDDTLTLDEIKEAMKKSVPAKKAALL